MHERRGAFSLDAPHARHAGSYRRKVTRVSSGGVEVGAHCGRSSAPSVLVVTHPVSGDVTGVANREHVYIGGVTQGVYHLKSGGFLTLQTVGVN